MSTPSLKELWTPLEALISELAELPDREFVEAIQGALETRGGLADAADEVAVVVRLAMHKQEVLVTLAWPARRITSGASDMLESTIVEAKAMSTVLSAEMFDSKAVSKVLGATSSNTRDAASARRARSELVGIPSGTRFLYPAFQLDLRAQRVFPVVAAINRYFEASNDPWGVASWWVTPHPRCMTRALRVLLERIAKSIYDSLPV